MKNERENPPCYTAEIAYTSEKVKLLTEMQYNTFCYGRKIGQTVAAIALLVMGAYGGKHPLGIVCLALGSFLIVSLNYRPKTTADQICKSYRGNFPRVSYSFSDTGVSTQMVPEETKYGNFLRLMEDTGYLYLYFNQATAFMVDKSTVQGEGGCKGLKAFLEQKTELEWKKPFSIFRGGSPIWKKLAGKSKKPGNTNQ